MRRNCGACFNTSPGMGKGRQSHPRPLIAASLAASRWMSAMEKQNATRDQLWPRNYSCWIRAPEPAGLPGTAARNDTNKGGFHMKTIARYWEERFEELESDGRGRHYAQRLEWFLFQLHWAVQTFETQSDGSKLLIFDDGSVYGEESELDAFSPRRDAGNQRQQHFRMRLGAMNAAERGGGMGASLRSPQWLHILRKRKRSEDVYD